MCISNSITRHKTQDARWRRRRMRTYCMYNKTNSSTHLYQCLQNVSPFNIFVFTSADQSYFAVSPYSTITHILHTSTPMMHHECRGRESKRHHHFIVTTLVHTSLCLLQIKHQLTTPVKFTTPVHNTSSPPHRTGALRRHSSIPLLSLQICLCTIISCPTRTTTPPPPPPTPPK